jgi:hypothetical protein
MGYVALIMHPQGTNSSAGYKSQDISLNQDTKHGPSYIEMYTKLPLK